MKRFLFIIITIITSGLTCLAGELVLKGFYQGENIFVKNPFASSGVGFCIYEVNVNGFTTTDEINSSAFEINLNQWGLKMGEELTVIIRYKSDCKPIVVNPQALNAKASFTIKTIRLAANYLEWFASDERGQLPYFVEQFMWNKWVRVGEIMAVGTPGQHSYSKEVRFHSGLNRFRLKQVDSNNNIRYSQELTFYSDVKTVTFSTDKADNQLNFSSSTMYEIYDAYGNIVFKGYGTSVKIASLKKGLYYLNFDNQMGQFTKK